MVLKRKLNCGSNGFDFPNIPKAPRSNMRKVPCKRANNDDSQVCAIDLLASLAGKLLEESESSSSTYAFRGDKHNHVFGVIKQEHEYDYNQTCKSELSDQGNPVSKSATENTSEMCLQFFSLENGCILKQTPVSDCKRALSLKPLEGCENKKGDCDFLVESGDITEETGAFSVGARFEQAEANDGDVKRPPGTDGVSNGSFEGYGNHSKLVCRDNDENYCKYYKLGDKLKSTQVGNRRIKKPVIKKYGRSVSRSNCFEGTGTDGYLKALYRKRKLYNGYNSLKHETGHRKRRLSDKGVALKSDGLSSESVSNSPQKGESENGVFSSAIGLHSKDSRVKFSIKSLRIPELLVEVSKTATVGSLKRTVKEAVTALLGSGIRIGMLVQGKKVRDDNNTISQTRLSCRGNLGNFGFTLEPGAEKLPVVSMPTDSMNLSERSAASPALVSRIPSPIQDADHLINSGNSVENNHELVLYQSNIPADKQPPSSSRALVPFSASDSMALAIFPVNEKPKRTELSQRRTRRPFSISEVEVLLQAVEELGTGRWRDVKLRSFVNASHRTYVDLKDKWKTLVHTASISRQQRRGKPVPQELLDRVLTAHKYWSQHQMKQNGKHQMAAIMMVPSGLSM